MDLEKWDSTKTYTEGSHRLINSSSLTLPYRGIHACMLDNIIVYVQTKEKMARYGGVVWCGVVRCGVVWLGGVGCLSPCL